MRFRLLRLTTVYPKAAEQFLRANPDYAGLSYRELYDRLLNTRFAESNYHAAHLNRLGHEAENVFASIEPLQKQWALEQEIEYDTHNWLADIAVAQVQSFQPDVLFVDDLYTFDETLRRRLVGVCRRRPFLLGWRAAPTDNFGQFRDLDLVLSSIAGLVRQFQQAGIRAELLHHAFETSLLDAVPPTERDVEFSFAGGLSSLHSERASLVEDLMTCTPLEVWGADDQIRWKDCVRWWLGRLGLPQKQSSRMRTLHWKYPGRVHRGVYGTEYFRLLGRSKIVLNSHISCSAEDASNMRLFEATGMGACLLTDRKSNLPKLFEPDVDVATYDSAEECAEKARFLLANESARQEIAAAGQRRTLSQHTFASRVETLVELIHDRMVRFAA